jgi:hypothetical protein
MVYLELSYEASFIGVKQIQELIFRAVSAFGFLPYSFPIFIVRYSEADFQSHLPRITSTSNKSYTISFV